MARFERIKYLQKLICNVTIDVIVFTFILFISFCVLFTYSWQTAAICILIVPFYFVTFYSENNITEKGTEDCIGMECSLISVIELITIARSAKNSLVFKLQFQKVSYDFINSAFQFKSLQNDISLSLGAFYIMFFFSITTFNIYSLFNESLMFGELIAVVSVVCILMSLSINVTVNVIHNELASLFIEIYEYIFMNSENSGDVKLMEFHKLEIKNLTLNLTKKNQLLKNINLLIEKGECIGLSGGKNSGKSTLKTIIQQFHDFHSGEIIINNAFNLSQIDSKFWRLKVSTIPQTVHIFDGNVLDNIVLDKKEFYSLAIRFCEAYGFDTLFTKLPQSYMTPLLDKNFSLSNTQRQLLGFARALFRSPALLIIDEALTSMDLKTKGFIFNILRNELSADTAILIIDQCQDDMKKIADRIYLLKEGGSVESEVYL